MQVLERHKRRGKHIISVLVLFMRMTMVGRDLVHHQAAVKLNCILTHADLFKFNKKNI